MTMIDGDYNRKFHLKTSPSMAGTLWSLTMPGSHQVFDKKTSGDEGRHLCSKHTHDNDSLQDNSI